MPQLTVGIRIPARLVAGLEQDARVQQLSIARVAKRRLVELLGQSPDSIGALTPVEPGAPGMSVVIGLSELEQEQLAAWRRKHALEGADSRFLSALFAGGSEIRAPSSGLVDIADRSAPSSTDFIVVVNDALGDWTRDEQRRIYTAIRAQLSSPDEKVLFCEASTGVGKTRAALAAGIERLLAAPDRIGWIASPSLTIMRQWVAELRRIHGAGIEVPRFRCVVGLQEFVGQRPLASFAEQNPEYQAGIEAWIARGGRGPNTPIEEASWLRSNLAEYLGAEQILREDLEPDRDMDSEDPALEAYRGQFEVGGTQLFLITHTMLAVEILRRIRAAHEAQPDLGQRMKQTRDAAVAQRKVDRERARQSGETLSPFELAAILADVLASAAQEPTHLGNPDFLIVDEAHQLEANCARALSRPISTLKLMRNLEALQADVRSITRADVQEVEAANNVLRMLWQQAGEPETPLLIAMDSDLARAAQGLLQAINVVLDRKRPKHYASPHLRDVQRDARALSISFSESRRGFRAFLTTTAVRHHPLIVTGRPSVDVELGFLWTAIARRGVMMSATLATGGGGLAGAYESARREAGVPAQRFASVGPIVPAWLTRGVTLHLPAPKSLFPPIGERDDPDARQLWLDASAAYIEQTRRTAAGGTLVLVNSYEDLETLHRLLGERPAVHTALRGRRIADLEAPFYRSALAGDRPVLIATGAAWTGLDLGGHRLQVIDETPLPAESDQVLTDLVIMRLPFGMNSTITHHFRKQVFGLLVESSATARLLKQGVGRLVRRQGLPTNRRIHILDRRILGATTRQAPMVAPSRDVLAVYEHRVLF